MKLMDSNIRALHLFRAIKKIIKNTNIQIIIEIIEKIIIIYNKILNYSKRMTYIELLFELI